MKAYIASSWFSPTAFQEVEDMKAALENNGYEYFSPKDFFVCPPSADLETQKATFDGNVHHVKNSDFVLCNTRDKDMGSIFEAGAAYAYNRPIVYFCAGLPAGALFNLMLSQSGIKVCTSVDELNDYLKRSREAGKLLFEPYAGKIE